MGAGKFALEGKYAEAVALHDRANGLSRVAEGHLRECDLSDMTSKYQQSIQQLQLRIRGAKCAVQAEAFLCDHHSADEPVVDNKCGLLERLDKWVEIKPGEPAHLIDFPPTVQPIPCKPVLYDLAFNHIQMPDTSHRAAPKKNEGMLGKAKGILGRLWG